jgi:hypothetical protein
VHGVGQFVIKVKDGGIRDSLSLTNVGPMAALIGNMGSNEMNWEGHCRYFLQQFLQTPSTRISTFWILPG